MLDISFLDSEYEPTWVHDPTIPKCCDGEASGIPIFTPIDLNLYCGKPPLHLVMYTLNSLELNLDVPDDSHV